MDLCFAWRFFYLASTIDMWGYDNGAAMSHKTTACEGGVVSGGVVEVLVHRRKRR